MPRADIADGAEVRALRTHDGHKGQVAFARQGAPQSSEWFHEDAWLSFNAIQEWPEHQVAWITTDWDRLPVKPTWVFEGRVEHFHRQGYRPEQWGAWQMRQQAYQSVFDGGFGHTYGNAQVVDFGHEGTRRPSDAAPAPGTWQEHLQDAGGLQMRHLVRLMASLSPAQYLDRIPDQRLIDGEEGRAARLASNRLTATRGGRRDYAMIYSANGRHIRLRMGRLAGPTMDAFWFNPRNGRWHAEGHEYERPMPFQQAVLSGASASAQEFAPPGKGGDGNDWVLVLRAVGGGG